MGKKLSVARSLKFIISHDIDHWRWSDHFFRDLHVPKHVARTIWLGATQKISLTSFARRFEWLWRRNEHHLEELIAFNDAHAVPATYFIGVRNGLSLSYSLDTAAHIVEWLRQRGCYQVGVHGIAYNEPESILQERNRFREIVGHDHFGIRMHYLRMNDQTLPLLSQAGYVFDSTTYGLRAPYRTGEMLEFPVGIMDVHLLSPGRNDLERIREKTISLIQNAEEANLEYFTINFHDPYFSEAYPDHKNWYIWLISWLRDRGYELTDFVSALELLKRGETFFQTQ